MLRECELSQRNDNEMSSSKATKITGESAQNIRICICIISEKEWKT